jgi:hypothetical protein
VSVEARIWNILFNGPDWQVGRELGYIAMDVRKLEDRIKQLESEVYALRLYGNKDCTSQADEMLAKEAKP